MALQLKTDFQDFYDHCFDKKGPVFDRYSKNALTRADNLAFLTDKGYNVPSHGIARNLVPHLIKLRETPDLHFVVYLDEYSHRGEDKIRVSAEMALEHFGEYFVVEFLQPDKQSTSYRYLQIGKKSFGLVYSSNDEWRSNCGTNVNVRLACHGDDAVHPSIKDPIFAIDFIKVGECLYALDFNSAPGIRHTGVEDEMKPREVYDEIHEAFHRSKKANGNS